MAEEKIQLNFQVPDAFFAELDRRFESLARRATQQFNQAARSGGLGTTPQGSSGNVPGGGGGQQISGAAGAFSTVASSLFAGAGAGIAGTPAAAASSPSVLAQNAGLGAAGAAVGLAKVGTMFAGGAVGAALGGPVGGAVGAGIGGLLGDAIQAQFNSVKEAMEIPTERGVARLKSIYGNFAAAGVETTAAERQQAIAFSLEVERRRYTGERQIERQYREQAARDSASFGLSWIGR